MKKVVRLLLILWVVALVGCGNNDTGETNQDSLNQSSLTNKKANEKDDLSMNIAIISSAAGVADNAFNEHNYNGVVNFIKNHPNAKATVTDVKASSSDIALVVKAVEDVVEDYQVIICCGYQFERIGEIASKHKDVKFILVDGVLRDEEGNKIELDNVYSMTFAEQESGFLAGMAAALETKTNKVAVVNGIGYPSNISYQNGFEDGVEYVNDNNQKNVTVVELNSYVGFDTDGKKVGGNYVGSFNDEETAKVIAGDLINTGCDIIFVAAGSSGKGAFTAVKDAKNVQVIGCDIDQYNEGINGNENIVLTSVLKTIDTQIEKQLIDIYKGEFKAANVILDATTDDIGYIKTSGRQQLSQETIEKLDEALEKIKKGEIDVLNNNQ